MNWIVTAIVLCFASYGLVMILNEMMNVKALIYSIVVVAVGVGVISWWGGGYYYLTSWIGLGIGALQTQDQRLDKK